MKAQMKRIAKNLYKRQYQIANEIGALIITVRLGLDRKAANIPTWR